MKRRSKWVSGARAVLTGLALVIGGATRALAAPEPAYVVDVRDGEFELRRYGPRVVAETVVAGSWEDAGNEGFRRLFRYIRGANRTQKSIAMTAPVGQVSPPAGAVTTSETIAMTAPVGQAPVPSEEGGARWLVTFVMPADARLDDLPIPTDDRVRLRALRPSRVAVVRFSGGWDDGHFRVKETALRRWMEHRALASGGAAEGNRYDPPFVPAFLRRNEVWSPVGEAPHPVAP